MSLRVRGNVVAADSRTFPAQNGRPPREVFLFWISEGGAPIEVQANNELAQKGQDVDWPVRPYSKKDRDGQFTGEIVMYADEDTIQTENFAAQRPRVSETKEVKAS